MHRGSVGRANPQDGGNGGDGQLGQHAAGADHDPVPFVPQGPGARSVHKRQRGEDQKGHAHLVHLAAGSGFAPEMFARKGVAQLMDQFYDDKRGIQQGQVLRVQDARGLRGQRFNVATDGPQPDGQEPGPQDRTGHGERFADDTNPPVQKSVRVPQRNADEKEIPDGALHLAPDALLVPLEERLRIGGQVALQ